MLRSRIVWPNVELSGARRQGAPADWRMMTDVRRAAGVPCRCVSV